MIESVSPRLGIKSSLPDHLQAFVTAYLIWKTNDKPVAIEYSEEYIDAGITKIKFKERYKFVITERGRGVAVIKNIVITEDTFDYYNTARPTVTEARAALQS